MRAKPIERTMEIAKLRALTKSMELMTAIKTETVTLLTRERAKQRNAINQKMNQNVASSSIALLSQPFFLSAIAIVIVLFKAFFCLCCCYCQELQGKTKCKTKSKTEINSKDGAKMKPGEIAKTELLEQEQARAKTRATATV